MAVRVRDDSESHFRPGLFGYEKIMAGAPALVRLWQPPLSTLA